jgi:hypothetical protein
MDAVTESKLCVPSPHQPLVTLNAAKVLERQRTVKHKHLTAERKRKFNKREAGFSTNILMLT